MTTNTDRIIERRDKYDSSGQKPEFSLVHPPHLHDLMSAPVEFRNRELLEYVYYLLANNTPAKVVAEFMSNFFWSLDNSFIPETFEKDEQS